MTDSQQTEKKIPFYKKKQFWRDFFSNLFEIGVLVIVLLLIRIYVIAPFQISGKSMEQSLHDHELILTNKFIYGNFFGWQVGTPTRGDIVVFRPPHDHSTFFIKRVIGVPGDRITFDPKHVYVNDTLLKEPYTKCTRFEEGRELDNWCNYRTLVDQDPFVVPEGSYFVMGDNRSHSSDSRTCFTNSCTNGFSPFVPLKDIEGKALLVLWPLWQPSDVLGEEGVRFAPSTRFDLP